MVRLQQGQGCLATSKTRFGFHGLRHQRLRGEGLATEGLGFKTRVFGLYRPKGVLPQLVGNGDGGLDKPCSGARNLDPKP